MAAAGLKIGDRVCALVAGGGYAELASRRSASACRCPTGLTDIEAASLPETFFTVWTNVFDRGRLQPGETLLVHGGTSGIGVTAIQMAKALRRDGDRHRRQRREVRGLPSTLGADHAINYKTQDFVAEVQRLTGGAGVDVVLDMVAGDYVAREIKCLAEDGRARDHRGAGRHRGELDAGLVLRRRLTITGSTLRPRPVEFKARDRRGAAQERLAAARERRDQARDPPGLPGRPRRRRRTR